MKMRRVVEWLFFIICFGALLYSSFGESGFNSSETAGHDPRPLMKEKQLKNVFESRRTSIKVSQEALYVEKERKLLVINDQNKKGKGTYGGGDLLRPRSKKNGANSLLLKSSSLLPTLLLRFVTPWLLLTIFFF
ncbi:hypothetical protein DITRI_Ditri03aG0018600 [Diplodiscus trichospermus]